MPYHIRPYRESDTGAIIQLSLLAWEPVFQSFEKVLGPEIYRALYPDWRKSQAEEVGTACRDRGKYITLVAEVEGRVTGFLTYELNLEDKTGEVMLLAVHPDDQNGGIGTALNNAALEEMRSAGMRLAVVGTGGDEGHAPARRTYEKAGYTALPLVRYYKNLS